MKLKTIKAYASRIAKLEQGLEEATSTQSKSEIQVIIDGIMKQFMLISKNDLAAIFELDYQIQKMLTK